MKLIKPYFEIIKQPSGLEGIYKQIELCGRVAYKSEDKITEDSAKEFVERMIKSKHGAVLEHGAVYLKSEYDVSCLGSWRNSIGYKYNTNKYSKVTLDNCADFRGIYITTNMRVLIENGWLDDLKYICEPTEHHEKRVAVRFVCDRGVSHEFVRHRVFSFVQESTRFCNYSKDKFNNEVTFIAPCWMNIPTDCSYDLFSSAKTFLIKCSHGDYDGMVTDNCFLHSCLISEQSYLALLERGWTPQQARSVLPNSLKTELIMTGFVSDWKHFFELRTPPNAHPQARELAIPLQEEFIKRKYI